GSLESVFAGKSEKEIAQMKLLAGTGLCLFFMIAEVIGGIVAHSLAVMTDAAHMLSDVAGFLVGIMSLYLTSRAANSKYSFGFHIAEVLGALVSVSIVWLMTAMLVFEATNRLVEPEVVDGKVMFWVSLLGLAMNFVLMQVLGHGHGGHGGHGHGEHGHGHAEHGHAEHGHAEHGHAEHGHAEHGHSTDSMALKAAMVHVIGDIVQSVGVCVAAALIWAFSDRWLDENGISYWYRIDPVCTYLFSILVIVTTYSTVKEAVHMLMAGRACTPSTPLCRTWHTPSLPPQDVIGVHDVHIWSLNSSKRNMWAHLVVGSGADNSAVLRAAEA
ncbi:hypothetical protein EMIHUDRAFT_42691, partial [Emiliania huxleyi CCMP1516]|uniref:Cation efflux protein transmembrane domain-containing protein n=2 Tax=Emiliania huxleyi TaxID=2903 RepID=A0A0D3IDV0_EMIH1